MLPKCFQNTVPNQACNIHHTDIVVYSQGKGTVKRVRNNLTNIIKLSAAQIKLIEPNNFKHILPESLHVVEL